MKKIIRLLAVVLLAFVVVGLVSCDKKDAMKKAYEKKGYNVTIVEGKKDDDGKGYSILTATKGGIAGIGGDSAIIWIYPDEDALKEAAGDDYKQMKKDGKINANCLWVSGSSEGQSIFKKA